MERYEPYISIATAIGIGLLIGLERERASPPEDEELSLAAGVRTHALVALLGGGSGLLAPELGPWPVAAAFLGVALLAGLSYRDALARGGDRGMTSEVALLVTFVLGVLCASEGVFVSSTAKLLTASALAVGTTALLSVKGRLHAIAGALTGTDVRAALKFLITAVIVLPLLPDRTYGPFDVLNPFHVGTMIVLVVGMDFAGYVAVRCLGTDRGIGLTGLVGGMVSSTAVTLSMAARAKKEHAVASRCAAAVVVASTIMLGRVVLLVAIVEPSLLDELAVPFGAMAGVAVLATVLLHVWSRRREARAEAIRFDNPVGLAPAIRFGLVFGVVLLVSKAAATRFGAAGAYVTAAVSGVADVNPVTLSMARLAPAELDPEVAAAAIALAAVANTVVKGAMAAIFGGWAFGRLVLLAFAGVFVAGGLGIVVLAPPV